MIKVLKAGLYTTVQDLGRYGFRNQGVPVSGAMDQEAALLANSILGNAMHDAVLEITMLGPTLLFRNSTTITVTGAPFTMHLNSTEIVNNQVITVHPNDVLTIGKARSGMRCYLAVKGGIQTELVLGSRSFYKGVTASAVLKKEDELPYIMHKTDCVAKTISEATKTSAEGITVYKGPEFNELRPEQQHILLQNTFKVSPQSNRMAYLLAEDKRFTAKEMITSPVQPGTVQLTPSGKLIVLMRDAQVSGGYARVLQLSGASVDALSQKRGGDTVRFTLCDIPE